MEVMAKVKVFVHASHADADGRAMTLAPQTYVPASYKLWYQCERSCNITRNTHVQYESLISSSLKAMAKVKVFQK